MWHIIVYMTVAVFTLGLKCQPWLFWSTLYCCSPNTLTAIATGHCMKTTACTKQLLNTDQFGPKPNQCSNLLQILKWHCQCCCKQLTRWIAERREKLAACCCFCYYSKHSQVTTAQFIEQNICRQPLSNKYFPDLIWQIFDTRGDWAAHNLLEFVCQAFEKCVKEEKESKSLWKRGE